MSSGERIALFGGAFDPVHNGHLAVARAALGVCSLDRIFFIPTWFAPHKQLHAPYADRLRMVELAIEGQPRFEASRLDEGRHPSYSVDTIRLAREQNPRAGLYFLIGADAFAEIESWRRWREVVESVTFIVARRPGFQFRLPDAARVEVIDSTAFQESSTGARAGRLDGVPEAVADYIRYRGLYRSGPCDS